MRIKGKITSWNKGKSYGFIEPLSGGKQVFIHITAFKKRSRQPEMGQVVTYSISTDKHGRPCAVNARWAGDRLQVAKKHHNKSISIYLAILFIGMVSFLVVSGRMPLIVLIFYCGLSIVTFIAYASDKLAAKNGAWRTQESTLHLFSLAGGWPGALIAQQKLRHKSRKASFRFVFWVTVILNVTGVMWIFTETGSALLNSLFQSAS